MSRDLRYSDRRLRLATLRPGAMGFTAPYHQKSPRPAALLITTLPRLISAPPGQALSPDAEPTIFADSRFISLGPSLSRQVLRSHHAEPACGLLKPQSAQLKRARNDSANTVAIGFFIGGSAAPRPSLPSMRLMPARR